MRILFDQGTPAPLREFLPDHQISTAYEMGWSTLKNGELLDRAEASGFEVLVTTDKNIRHHQNLLGRRIAILVLSTTSWPRILRCVEDVNRALGSAHPGVCLVADIA